MKNFPQLTQHGYLYLIVFIHAWKVGSQACGNNMNYHQVFMDMTVQEAASFTQSDVQTTNECMIMCGRRLRKQCVGMIFNKQTRTCAGYNVSLHNLTRQSQVGSVAYGKEASDCMELWLEDKRVSGVYTIHARDGGQPIDVFCEMTNTTSWLVIQKRLDGSVNFTKTWNEYKDGFGDISNEFWLGNTNIHRLTSQGTHKLRVDLERFNGETKYAVYNNFSLEPETDNFTLHLGDFSGDAGDSLRFHENEQFYTIDRDNANDCAVETKGGWWYSDCLDSDLNGEYIPQEENYHYGQGIAWYGNNDWLDARQSLKTASMKIQPDMNG